LFRVTKVPATAPKPNVNNAIAVSATGFIAMVFLPPLSLPGALTGVFVNEKDLSVYISSINYTIDCFIAVGWTEESYA